MRVFPIAKPKAPLESHRHLLRETGILPQVLRNSGIIDSHVLKSLLSQPLTLRQSNITLLQLLQNQRIIRGVNDDNNPREVLRRCPNHRGTTNINLLQSIIKTNPRLSHCLDKGIEIDSD